jgi:Protein of unknown function (DUF2442)
MNLRKLEKLSKNNQPTIYPTEKVENYPLIMKVECTKEEITAFLEDGRKVSIPTAWYPRTRSATLKQLKNFRLTSDKYGIHWPEIDEDLSIRAFFKGPGNH